MIFFSVLYNASFAGYGNCVSSKCTNGSPTKVAERCTSLQIPMCGLYIIIKNSIRNVRVLLHILLIFNLFVLALKKWIEERAFGDLSSPVSQRVQLNFTFSSNVRILCLSCNVKNSKTTAKLSKRSRSKRRCNRFLMVSSEKYVLLLFLAFALQESGTRKAISWSVAVYKKQVSSPCNLISQTEQMHDK